LIPSLAETKQLAMQIKLFARVACIVAVLAQTLIPSSSATAQNLAHRWGGLVSDPFVQERSPGLFEAWTAEDGGRIRHRNPQTGLWSFQTTPDVVKDQLHRIFFLPDGQTGWAVGNNGWVLKTTNGGVVWSVATTNQVQIYPTWGGSGGPDELFDVHFLNATEGWLVGKYSFNYSVDGGASWLPVLMAPSGNPFALGHTDEGYALDIIERPGDLLTPASRLGFAVFEPGYVFRSTDLITWEQVFFLPDVLVNPGSYPCIQLTGCENLSSPRFEPWDVEISRHPTEKMVLFCGGRGVQCGLIFSSPDDGDNWCKEWHECACSGPGCNTSCGSDPAYDTNASIHRLSYFASLYGIAIQPSDNSAIAVGYNGQQLMRDPSNGVWKDRSVFSGVVPTPAGSVKFPLMGVAMAGTLGQSRAIATGMGGLLRESGNGGHTYAPGQSVAPNLGAPIAAEPHRIRDVHFIDEMNGWHVGQHGRIAVTIDGGFSWSDQNPIANPVEPTLQAIAFDSIGAHGVAVGGYVNASNEPRIRYTVAGGSPWKTDVTIDRDDVFDDRILREVECSSPIAGSDFWAVGDQGLIMKSGNGGQAWNHYVPAGEIDFHLFYLEGVSFLNPTTGIMVGRRPNPAGSNDIHGAAHQYRDLAGVITWNALVLPHDVTKLTDVDVDATGNIAYAVGEKDVNGSAQGVVLASSYTSAGGGSFGAFTEVPPPAGGFPRCTIGDDLLYSVLSEVEIAPNGDVWVAGMCGRVWKYASSAWSPVRSQMDAHVVGMSLVPTQEGYVGYIGGLRRAQQCIVKVP
jgi:photosystem II stability/assembly factor-like uncharacterized protein